MISAGDSGPDRPIRATQRPLMLIGVRVSLKRVVETKMVAISLNMPATDSVTTEVRWIRLRGQIDDNAPRRTQIRTRS